MFGSLFKPHGDHASPAPSTLDRDAAAKQGYASNGATNNAVEFDELHVVCPPHTTEKALVRKIDLRVIPFLCILYLLAFLDRVNIANAQTFGLAADLKLTGLQYNTCLTIFFVPYVFFEIPSNILLKRQPPRIWLSLLMFLFGLVSICQGLVHNYGGLLTTRFFLGMCEAGMFPGSFYLIGMWYKRSESQRRYSFFFSSTTLAGAFGGLLASAIGKMDYMRGYRGWRWIFILEGVLTCVVALAFFFLIPGFPEQATWLTDEERAYVVARLQVDQGRSAVERKITLRDVGRVFKDYKIYLGGFMYFGLIVPGYGYAFFAPTIIKTYGYSNIRTQLYSVPPWACAFAFAMIIAFLSDKFQHRFLFVLIPECVAIAGFAILMRVHDNNHVEYAALFLVTMGTYAAMPVTVCWFNMNLGGHHRRAVGTAWQVGFGNIGGIIATYAFLSTDAKKYYHTGYSISISFVCLSALTSCIYALAITRENRKRDGAVVDVGLSEYEKTELGDLSPDYRYFL
ncbi:MAG: hypothetical protein M1818_004168 [Claussenomyces sp. TS43310]|nr:MAG: hypothetical protein M1818_004168 [Claussenomyces sp. TS43310]